jgi:RNA polymerase subunit RPABC4/transcription elongation factor Spt4
VTSMNRQSAAGAARRCRSCGALATADADWCGQCFAPLREPEAPPPAHTPRPVETTATSPEAVREATKVPTWPCATCGERNAIELDVCPVCGSSFASLMRQDERPREVDPKDALVRSLIFPGLGHRLCGYPLDGLARGVLFGMIAVMAFLVGLSGTRSTSLKLMFLLFCVLAALVYVGSAYEAYGLAAGGRLLVNAKQILWATVAVVMVSVGMLAMSVMTTPRR